MCLFTEAAFDWHLTEWVTGVVKHCHGCINTFSRKPAKARLTNDSLNIRGKYPLDNLRSAAAYENEQASSRL